MIKAVLFDFGGVLSEAGKPGSTRRIFGDVYGADLRTMEIDDILHEMWRGKISDEAFIAEIKRRHPHLPATTVAQFQAIMGVFERSEPVYQLAEQLRGKGVKTGILSNAYGIGVTALRSGGFYDGFDPVLLSCEIGYAKPEPAAYELAIKRFGVKSTEILFIDDQQRCLDPAAEMGMQVLLAESPEQIVQNTWKIIEEQQAKQ